VRRRLKLPISGYFAGPAAIGLITLIYYRHILVVKTTTVVLTFLLVILTASAIWGLGVSVFMSVIAMLCVDYFFLPPVGTFNINDPEDWITLFSFLVTAVIGSGLSAHARRQALVATNQRNEVNRLYEFSQSLLSARNLLDLLREIPTQLVKSFQVDSAALYVAGGGNVYRAGPDRPELDIAYLKATLATGKLEMNIQKQTCYGPVLLGSQIIGSLGIFGSMVSNRTFEAITALIAAAVDRAQAIALLGKTEAARENERLKSVLLDAIAHDFKTPLTSIKAAATSLLDDLEFNKRQRGELLEVIDEECDRINRVIGQAIEMAQLDAGEAKLRPVTLTVGELLAAALEDCESIQATRLIRTEVHQLDSRVHCDLFWTRKVLDHLIRNSDLYSSPGEPITITTEEKDGFIIFKVADVGPGIEPAEIDLIFGKFFRGKGQRHRVPGTGMGLSVARAIVEAHGGTIGVTSEAERGSTFTFSLPVESGMNATT
jgi:two-component system sensor histidine kinase KdpD